MFSVYPLGVNSTAPSGTIDRVAAATAKSHYLLPIAASQLYQ